MKKLLFLILITIPCLSYSEAIVINIPNTWRAHFEDSIADLDVWIMQAIVGKNNKAEDRIILKEIALALQNGDPIPSTRQGIIDNHLARSGYKNRQQRNQDRLDNNLREGEPRGVPIGGGGPP